MTKKILYYSPVRPTFRDDAASSDDDWFFRDDPKRNYRLRQPGKIERRNWPPTTARTGRPPYARAVAVRRNADGTFSRVPTVCGFFERDTEEKARHIFTEAEWVLEDLGQWSQ